MKTKKILITFLFLSVLIACKNNSEKKAIESSNEEPITSKLAKVPNSWINKRVKNAKLRLEKSEAGSIVWNAMEAHGGLETWYKNGPVSFQFYTSNC